MAISRSQEGSRRTSEQADFAAQCHKDYMAAGANKKARSKMAKNLGINEDLLASIGVPEDLERFVNLFEAGEFRHSNAGAGATRDSEVEKLIKKHYNTYTLEKASRSSAAVNNLATNCGIRLGYLKSIDVPATEAKFVNLYFENKVEITVGPIVGLEQPQPPVTPAGAAVAPAAACPSIAIASALAPMEAAAAQAPLEVTVASKRVAAVPSIAMASVAAAPASVAPVVEEATKAAPVTKVAPETMVGEQAEDGMGPAGAAVAPVAAGPSTASMHDGHEVRHSAAQVKQMAKWDPASWTWCVSGPPTAAVSSSKPSNLLYVAPDGCISLEELQRYTTERSRAIAVKLSALSGNVKVTSWWDAFSVEGLYSEGKYQGDADGEHDAVASLHRAKTTDNPLELVAAVDDFIRFFCGFHSIKARCLTNAAHFQFEVDHEALTATELPKPSESDVPSDDVRGIFDQSEVAAGELLLRVVVETDGGSLIANPFSAGKSMGLLQKLPVYAQYVMVLTNAVEAVWYEQSIPNCKLSLNVYAALLVDDAPVLEMLDGVSSVEVMEMSKGVERGGVSEWVKHIRDRGIEVLLDDFDSKHPGAGSSADGVKICVFANAFHTLQAFNEDGAAQDAEIFEKEKLNDMDFRDYHCSLVPSVQPRITKMVFEGSENCMKSTVTPGPPLYFGNAQATLASAHVYQTAARIQRQQNPGIKMVHQGGRALYDGEEFDDDVLALLRNLGKDPAGPARKGDAGTMAWIGVEAKRRADMKTRPLVCGVRKAGLESCMDQHQ